MNKWSEENDDELTNIMPLADIAEYIEGVSAGQLTNWSDPKRNNGFPEPAEVLGRYKLYERDKVIRWVKLWKIANKRLGRGDALNKKENSNG